MGVPLGIARVGALVALGIFCLAIVIYIAAAAAAAVAAAAAAAVAAGFGGSSRPCCRRRCLRMSVQAVVQFLSEGNEVRPRHREGEYHRGGRGRLALVLPGLSLAKRIHAKSSPVSAVLPAAMKQLGCCVTPLEEVTRKRREIPTFALSEAVTDTWALQLRVLDE